MGKYAKYERKYCTSWEKETWAKGWLREQKSADFTKEAFCSVCKIHLRAHKADLLKHSKTTGHMRKYKALKPSENRQSTLNSHFIVDITNEEKEVDIKLAVFIAVHTSIRSVDHLGDLLKQIGQPNKFQNLRLHRTKCSALVKHVIGPSLLEKLKERLVDVPFSLIVDESTDCSVFKFLSIFIKFFDESKSKICTEFAALIPVESVAANDLFQIVKKFVHDMGLPLARMTGIGTDGASSLCGKNHSLYTLLKEENPHLQLVRCICHSVDNAASSAVGEMPACIEFLCREVYNWFSHSSQRRMQYQRLFDILNGTEKVFHNFLQISSTRWLARFNAVNRLIENYEELKVHFSTVVNKEKCYSARLLNDMLQDNSNFLSLVIIRPILFETNKLNLIFQKDDMDLGNAYEHVSRLMCLLGSKILKPAFVQGDPNMIIENYDNPLAYVQPHQSDFGIEYQRALPTYKVDVNEKQILEIKCFNYIKKLLGELIKRLPDHLDLFKKISVLTPQVCLNQVTRSKFSDLPFLYLILPANLYVTENEYNSLTTVDWTGIVNEDVLKSSQKFWTFLYNFKNCGEEFPFRNISKFMVQILTLPSSNAVVERGFSIMNAVKTKVRNKLGVELLNGIIRIRLNAYSEGVCCTNFHVTKAMYQKFNTSTMYSTKHVTGGQSQSTADADDSVIDIFEEINDL